MLTQHFLELLYHDTLNFIVVIVVTSIGVTTTAAFLNASEFLPHDGMLDFHQSAGHSRVEKIAPKLKATRYLQGNPHSVKRGRIIRVLRIGVPLNR